MERTMLSMRVRTRGVLAGLALVLAPGVTGAARAQDEVEQDEEVLLEGEPAVAGAEVPSYGAARPGPVRPSTRRTDEAEESADAEPAEEEAAEGVPPVAMVIDKIGVDAEVERLEIPNETGVMPDPSGPWVVSWYENLAALGDGGNVVMSGHVDYWTTGPAVFYELNTLAEDDLIRLYGEDGEVYEYAFDWMRNYVVAELDKADLQEIVGPTEEESLTVITCAIGTWDEAAQEYRERAVLRATRVE